MANLSFGAETSLLSPTSRTSTGGRASSAAGGDYFRPPTSRRTGLPNNDVTCFTKTLNQPESLKVTKKIRTEFVKSKILIWFISNLIEFVKK